MDSAQTDTVSDWGQEEGESQFNRNAPKCEQSKARAIPRALRDSGFPSGLPQQSGKLDPEVGLKMRTW